MAFLTPTIAHTQAANLVSSSETETFHLSQTDVLNFGKFWPDIKPFAEEGCLAELIRKRRREVAIQKEEWRILIRSLLKDQEPDFYQSLSQCLSHGTLTPLSEGLGGTYLLLDHRNVISYVVKPIDEDILCFNNRKYYGTPFNHRLTRVRPDIPLYRSPQTCAAAAAIAHLCHLENITPKTHLAIIKTPIFYDIADRNMIQLTGLGDKEKLCSVQEYLAETTELYDKVREDLDKGIKEIDIGYSIDQEDFELANIFIWICFDNDAHAGNFRCFKKANGLFGLKKIDNNLAFPEKNSGLNNCLSLFPNAEQPVSEKNLNCILKLPTSKIIEVLHFYGLEQAIPACLHRLAYLKHLAKQKLTIKEINNLMSELESLKPISIREYTENNAKNAK